MIIGRHKKHKSNKSASDILKQSFSASSPTCSDLSYVILRGRWSWTGAWFGLHRREGPELSAQMIPLIHTHKRKCKANNESVGSVPATFFKPDWPPHHNHEPHLWGNPKQCQILSLLANGDSRSYSFPVPSDTSSHNSLWTHPSQ